MTSVAPLPAILGNVGVIGMGTSSFLSQQELSTYQSIADFPERLAALDTTIVYIDPFDNVFHLSGPNAGREGVRLGLEVQGEQHLPFAQVLIEGAYMRGAVRQRTNILKREINCRVTIGGAAMNNFAYRMCEDRWWSGQVEDRMGWLGVFTRFSGWRWTRVIPSKTVDTTQRLDPVAYGNNFATWDIYWTALFPYYSKPATHDTWDARFSGAQDKDGYFHGNIVLANRGDTPTNVSYLITGQGYCVVQDNHSDRMVELPPIYNSDGAVLVSTDPAQIPVTAENDPQDNELYKSLRASGILDFFLSSVTAVGEPIWKRRYTRFMYETPPQSITHFTVKHTNQNAKVTAFLPQMYRRSR